LAAITCAGWKFSPHFPTIQPILIIAGVAVIAFGILWPWVVKIPLFRLPEDIVVTKPHLRVYVLMTSIVVLSVVISLLLRIIRRLT